jgi:hypothetical protein
MENLGTLGAEPIGAAALREAASAQSNRHVFVGSEFTAGELTERIGQRQDLRIPNKKSRAFPPFLCFK